MITKQDVLEAIAECQGTRNPNANTAIKLAAFYTILDHIEEKQEYQTKEPEEEPRYSFSTGPPRIEYNGDSEFAKLIDGRLQSEVLPVIDELMSTIKALNERLYDAVIRKLN